MTDDFGMTRVEAVQFLLLTEIFLDVSIELEHRTPLTVSFREGMFTTRGGETVLHEVDSLDEQSLQEQAVQTELFPEDPPHRPCETAPPGTGSPCTCDFDCDNYWIQASWKPSPPEALRVFMEYDDLTGEFDE